MGYNPWGRKRVGHNLATKQQTNIHVICIYSLNFFFILAAQNCEMILVHC